ncbi:hypothetical protein LJC06_03320 [Bacteroidales bacterium OttesenSCG-928-I14]|nr:hypothetical protein [Bacteroidales bacterium OttesenSCG-928-I14]
MQNINFHIAYLLTKHECVIVPDFGAFIAYYSPAKKEENAGLMCPPCLNLRFNSEISHNDGLLVNSLIKEKDISYNEAVQLTKQYVEHLNYELQKENTVNIPWVGSFVNTNDRLEFHPDSKLSCNFSNYGLSNFYLPLLTDIVEEHTPVVIEHEAVRTTNKRRYIPWSVAAAAVVGFLFVSQPAQDVRLSDYQSATLMPISLPTPVQEQIPVENDSLILAEEIFSRNDSFEDVKAQEPVKKEVKKYYYIVIASLPTQTLAEKKIEEYKTTFSQAGIVSKDDKHRIYVNRFLDKEEAESFLEGFRVQYPKHEKAWLLSQRSI